MKTLLKYLTVASLVLNVFLVAVVFVGRNSAAPAVAPAIAATSSTKPAAAPALTEQVWADLASTDLPGLLQKLRASGFPTDMVRAILAAQLRESFAARRKAMDPAAESRPYWKSAYLDPKYIAAIRQMDREQRKILRELLGPDAESPDNTSSVYQGRRLESVPADKVTDVRNLLRDFDELRNDVYGMGGFIGVEQQRRIAALETDQQAALARLLTPQEFEEFNLRNSETARQVRYQLSAFDPSETEFKTIYALQADFDKQFGRLYTIPSPEEQQRRNEAQRILNDQIKSVVGPTRAEDYDRAMDYSYRQTSQLVSRLELPPETTGQVWTAKKDFEDRARALHRNAGLDPAERTRQLAALGQEANTRLTTILGGPRGMEAYKQYGGNWLQTFTPQTRTFTSPAR